MNPKQKDQMHPEDIRNLIIFALASIAIWFMYDSFVIAPQAEAMKEARKARAELLLNDPSLFEEDEDGQMQIKPLEPVKRSEAISGMARVEFSNEIIKGSISLKGGRIDDLILKEHYRTFEKKEKVSILNPARSDRARFIDMGWVSGNKNLNLPGTSTVWHIRGNTILEPGTPVTLFWDNGQGVEFERVMSLDEKYMFNVTQRVINKSGTELYLHPYGLISQTGIPLEPNSRRTWVSYEGPMGFIGGSLEHMSYGAMEDTPSKKIEAERGWVGFSDKYWLTALIPSQDQLVKYRFKHTPDVLNSENHKYQTDYTGAEMLIKNGETAEYSQHLYAGVKEVLTLEAYQDELKLDKLDLAIDFGWFWFFTYPFFLLLHFLGLIVGNMGVAIIIQTIILRMAVFPLTNISYRSFAKMKVVAPQITELREKHNDDKEKLQAEIVQLYQREGVNPMSGCLPILVQIPIFFAFYKILFTTIEIRHVPFVGWIQDLSGPDPTNIFNLFGLLDFDVSFLPAIGVWPCLMLMAMLVQRKLNPPPQDKTQRMMMNFFPFFITYVMSRFASGLVIYWTFSATLSVLQQMYIMRSLNVPIYIFSKDKTKEELEDKITKGEDVHPLIEMAEDEVGKALFGEGEDVDSVPSEPQKDIKPPKPKKKKKKK